MPNSNEDSEDYRKYFPKVNPVINGQNVWTQEGVDNIIRAYRKNNNKSLRDHLINSSRPLVISISKKYFSLALSLGLSREDVIGYGNIGLINSIDRYDLEKEGRNFLGYASRGIRAEILNNIGDLGRTIRIPRHRLPELQAIANAQKEYEAENDGYSPSAEDLADMTGFSLEKIKLLTRDLRPASLDTPISKREGNGHSLVDLIYDKHDAKKIDLISEKDNLQRLIESANLDAFELELLHKKFFEKGHIVPDIELKLEYGVSRETVRGWYQQVIRKIRTANKLIRGSKPEKYQHSR